MRTLRSTLSLALLALLLAGCGGLYHVRYDSAPEGRRGDPPDRDRRVAKLHVPPGHLPPPGSCRIWIPGVPPGRQSPPGRCSELAAQVPPGAWLLTRSRRDPAFVDVSVYDARQPGLVVEVNLYEADTGIWVRTITSR